MVTCKLCQQDSTFIINARIREAKSEAVQVYGCVSCGVQFLYPHDSETELLNYYDSQYRQEYTNAQYYLADNMKLFYEQSLPEARLRVARVKSLLNSQDDILEIGCSSGYFLSEISPFVSTVSGTEWDSKNREYAKAMGFTIERDIENFNSKFDKIFMFHVLEHIAEPIEFLKKIKQYLKPGGVVFIEVPNNEDILLTTYDLQAFRDFYYQSAHIWYFNKKSLGYALKEGEYSSSTILPVQRYDISNHIHWLKNRVPGGQAKYSDIFSAECNQEYVKGLEAAGKTDTLFVVCKD